MKKKIIRFVIVLCSLGILLVALGIFVGNQFQITSFEIEGNSYYTEEEIKGYLLEQTKYDNSLYLWWVFHTGKEASIPYVDSMDYELTSPHSVKVTVYEKGITGYFNYLGTHVYFDKDGMLVESSGKILEGIPQIKGIMFDHLTWNEKIPVENDEIFKAVVDTANVLNIADLHPDVISFSKNLDITLYFGDVCVLFGDRENLNEKANRLAGILPSLQGEKGTLYLKDYSAGKKSITFTKNED